MKPLLIFLIIGIIGVECGIYFVIPSELHQPEILGKIRERLWGYFLG